jgi:hypothetical protein
VTASSAAPIAVLFVVRLPIASASMGIASAEPVTLKGIHILIVDDDEDGRDMLRTALRDYGAIVHAAEAQRGHAPPRRQTPLTCHLTSACPTPMDTIHTPVRTAKTRHWPCRRLR